MTQGTDMIATERRRQIYVERWTAEHDSTHQDGDLACAGSVYALHAFGFAGAYQHYWPWAKEDFKPTPDQVRQLVKAGALIAAEIDRLLAQQKKEANHRAKLSEQDVQAIRLAARQGENQRSIAKRFGIGSGHAANIIAGRRWKHLIDNPAPAPEAGPDDVLLGHGADCLCDTCCAARALDATTRSER